MTKNLAILILLVGAFCSGGTSLLAQSAPFRQSPKPDAARQCLAPTDSFELPADQDIQVLRRGLRSQKKQIVAANMVLTDTEAEKFWPIYDRYAQELDNIEDTRLSLIREYAEEYDAMTDEQAKDYLRRRAAVEQSIIELRVKYIPIFGKALTAKETALFFQIEWRLGLFIDMGLAQMPVVNYQ